MNAYCQRDQHLRILDRNTPRTTAGRAPLPPPGSLTADVRRPGSGRQARNRGVPLL